MKAVPQVRRFYTEVVFFLCWYRKSIPNLLHSDRAVLVVMDMQEPFLRTVFERERVIRNVSALVKGAQTLRIPIISTTQYEEKMGGILPEIQELLPPLHSHIDKITFSGYHSPAFVSEVTRTGRRQVILCGVESHICISQTAHDLAASGFQAHVVADAVSSRTETNWKIGLDKMRQGGVLLSSVEMALYELLHEAGTPEFRDILQIVK